MHVMAMQRQHETAAAHHIIKTTLLSFSLLSLTHTKTKDRRQTRFPLFFSMASALSFLLFFLSSATLSLSFEPLNMEVMALIAIKGNLNDPRGVLSNWDETSVDPCSWAMITCSSENLVIGLGAPSQGLSGTLSRIIGNLTNLQQVLLQNNNITGEIPAELGMLPKLQTLDLSNNRLSGGVPGSLGRLAGLRYLRLNNNSLSGAIPVSLSRIPQLAFLDVSFNNLSVPVPLFPARTFNVVGNPLICGRRATECAKASAAPVAVPFIDAPRERPRTEKLAVALGAGLGAAAALLLSICIVLYWRSKQRRRRGGDEEGAPPPSAALGNLLQYGLRELAAATEGFSDKNVVGKGGFGVVYRGRLLDGTMVAVKRLRDGGGAAGEAQFRTEVEMISLAVHRHLLRLVGYCAAAGGERLLVYPFMANGSVAARLRAKPPLDWNTRKRIALGAARGLLYLHEQCDPKIIHRDVKAANVLLDDGCEAVVGDFGLAKLLDHGDSHVTTAVRGTVGHIAPEYLSTGQSSDKTDVFGFGILLLELVTGQRALEFGKAANQKGAMLDWVKKVHQEKRLDLLIDRDLEASYDPIDVGEMVQVALLSTQFLPSHRPKMSEVVRMLEGDGLADKWEATNRPSPASGSDNSIAFSKTDDDDDDDDEQLSMDGVEEMELSGPR